MDNSSIEGVSVVKNPSLLGGAMIIAGSMVGAGMFSLPVIMSGVWFNWSIVILLLTWFFMFHSGLMLLEANLNYHIGSSFDTITKDLLGQGWNIINGLTVAFVLYILTYAYISASGSVISHTLKDFNLILSPRIGGALFAILVASIVWISTTAVSRMTTFTLGVKILTFFLTFGSLLGEVKSDILFDVVKEVIPSNDNNYLAYLLITLPFCLASFGYHGNVPSLMKHYGKNPKRIRTCLLIGTGIALFLYIIWLVGTMGNISRPEFKPIINQGGNIDVLISALSGILNNAWIDILLIVFSNFAVACSFLAVSLGLFDYLADLFKFNDTPTGRFKTALVTFLPPIIAGVIYPDGFLYAIGFAGLAATVWAVIVPALLAQASRKRFGSPLYRVWGGNTLIIFVLVFGVINAVAHILSSLNLLPVYQ